MASRFSELVIKSEDPQGLADFWAEVLGFTVIDRGDGFAEVGPAEGFGGLQPTLFFVRSSDPRPERLRLHIDLNPTDRDQDAELERLLSIGARPADIGRTGEESWHVLQDPDGNEFCLLRPRLEA
ncbi:VOC family protein [Gryllotalpicola protaetiae]|uniref:VOC family protein n=1 Tax=Gryllotalpicola protaetiae TaxID=2419771 RepID=A0A387BLP6_9MICO|nr:VOC family protein [Gryllotalpicola protaetiae]AYG04813.1 VOC family protein [Gryllotalpicola protaetiae]